MKLITLLLLLLVQSLGATVIMSESNKHKYCEIHKDQDGTYIFFFVPHIDTTVSVVGKKSGKYVIWFMDMKGKKLDKEYQRTHSFLSKPLREGKITESDSVVIFVINPSIVDSLSATYRKLKPTDPPLEISYYETDLLALIEYAEKSGTLIDNSESTQTGANQPTSTPESKPEEKEKPDPVPEEQSE